MSETLTLPVLQNIFPTDRPQLPISRQQHHAPILSLHHRLPRHLLPLPILLENNLIHRQCPRQTSRDQSEG